MSSSLRRSTRWRVLSALLFASLLSGCSGGGDGGTNVPTPTSISLSTASITLTVIEQTSTVTATIRDESGASMSGVAVTWTSDAPSVASVAGTGATGTLTAHARGAAVITARVGTLTTGLTVLVRTAFAVSVSPSDDSLRVGGTLPLVATVSADEGAPTAVTWSSSAPAIASVNGQGLVTGIAPGRVVITARSTSDARLSDSATLLVLPPRGVFITPAELTIGNGESRTLSATVSVEAGLPTNVTWSSNRPAVASVNQQGVVTGVSDGEATITATAVADTSLHATAAVRVMPVIRNIVVSPATAELGIGQSRTFTAAVTADQGASTAITWSSSDPAVASVNAQGEVTAIALGTVTIRARAVADTTREGTATLTVTPRPVIVTLGTSVLGLTVGRSATLSAVVTADPGLPTGVQWTSRNSSIASVTDQGVVTAHAIGTTYVVASAVADPARQDSARVTVVPQLANGWTTTRLGGPLIEDVVSLWAVNPSLAYAVNALGDVFRWNGTEWTVSARGTDFNTTFAAVHGISANAVTAVGSNGVIARFNGTTWTAQPSGTTAALTDVWMYSANGAWAVGAGGVGLRYVGGAWTASNTGVTTLLRGVWGTGTVAFAVGDGGVIRRWQGGAWQQVTSGTADVLYDVWGDPNANNVYAVGEFGSLVAWNGTTFVPQTSGTMATLLAISGNASGTVFIAGNGVALTRVVNVWEDRTPPYQARFTAAAVDANGDLWVGGQRGLVLRESDDDWGTLSLTPDLLDVWSTSVTHAIAVGELGFIFGYDGTGWTRQSAPTLERLNTVWAASPDFAFAGGDNGVLLQWDGTVWSGQLSPTISGILAMWGANENDAWATTDGGEILRWDGGDWTVVHTHDEPLFGIYGTSPSDVHAVGVSGAALHWNGTAWTERHTGTSHLLVGVWASHASQVFAVGARDFASGVTMRYDGATWSELATGTNRVLSAIWGVVATDLYAVGEMGTILRYNGTGWQSMQSGTMEFLWAISGAPDASGAGVAVGLNGVIVQSGAAQGARVAGMRRAGLRGTVNLEPARGATRAGRGALPIGAARRGGR